MVSILFIFIRRDSYKLLFDIDDGFSRGQTRSVAEPENVYRRRWSARQRRY